jgi:hypothetical protein
MIVEGRKKTAVIECRTDIRILATIQQFFLDAGLVPSSRSELFRQSLKLLVEILKEQGKVRSYEELTNKQASEILESFSTMSIRDQRIKIMAKSLPQEKAKPIEDQLAASTDQAMAVVDIEAAKRAMSFISRGIRLSVLEWDSLPNEAQNIIPFELHPDRFAYLEALKKTDEEIEEPFLPPHPDLFKGQVV